MASPISVPVQHADSLRRTVDAVRGETYALKAAGLLAVSADDLLDGGGETNLWLADLEHVTDTAAMDGLRHGAEVTLPLRDPGVLQQVVYGLSAVLVWAHELHAEGRVATTIPMEALTAWAEVERRAGLGGRTAAAMGANARHPYAGEDALLVEAAGIGVTGVGVTGVGVAGVGVAGAPAA